jgi:hypothetical protein
MRNSKRRRAQCPLINLAMLVVLVIAAITIARTIPAGLDAQQRIYDAQRVTPAQQHAGWEETKAAAQVR